MWVEHMSETKEKMAEWTQLTISIHGLTLVQHVCEEYSLVEMCPKSLHVTECF